MDRDESLDRLFQIRGATKRVAKGLGITTAAVSQWRKVPRDRVIEVAAILGVEPKEVRADFDHDQPSEAA